MTDQHEPGAFYWEAGSDQCPHGAEPDIETEGEAWDLWNDRHVSSDDGPVCLDAPAGDACLACSAEDGDMVPWNLCRVREHARPKQGVVPSMDATHEPVTVLVGTFECLDRECDDYFGDDGNVDPGVERCSHIHEEQACSCQRGPDGEYGRTPCSAAVPAP